MNEDALLVESRTKILVAEDDERCADIVRKILLLENYDITLAKNGIEALQLFASHHGHFSLVLSDFEMPRMNGFQLAKKLLVMERRPFILMSGGCVPYEIERDLKALNVPILSKPFSRESFVKLVAVSIGQGQLVKFN